MYDIEQTWVLKRCEMNMGMLYADMFTKANRFLMTLSARCVSILLPILNQSNKH